MTQIFTILKRNMELFLKHFTKILYMSIYIFWSNHDLFYHIVLQCLNITINKLNIMLKELIMLNNVCYNNLFLHYWFMEYITVK
jgi:hypothetical protein